MFMIFQKNRLFIEKYLNGIYIKLIVFYQPVIVWLKKLLYIQIKKENIEEESKLEKGYFPLAFVAGYVTKDKGFADMDFNADVNGQKKAIKAGDKGYYGYVNIHKREGKDLDLKSAPEKFTMQELIALDPQWKAYFQGLCAIADKYGVQQ